MKTLVIILDGLNLVFYFETNELVALLPLFFTNLLGTGYPGIRFRSLIGRCSCD